MFIGTKKYDLHDEEGNGVFDMLRDPSLALGACCWGVKMVGSDVFYCLVF